MIKLRVKYLDSLSKITGLMGQEKIYPAYFETRFGVHTFGMRMPIDVFILDRDGNIISVKRGLGPNNFYFWNPKFFRVLETPTNLISQNSGKVILTFEN